MLPTAHRLSATNEIERVYHYGKKTFHPLLRLAATPAAKRCSRATVVVAKRVDLRATERNRIKRIIRALLPDMLTSLARPLDLVIIVQPRARGAKQHQLAKALVETMNRL